MSQSAIHCLVVEDEPSWQQILSEILDDSGLAVDVVDNPQAALERLRAVPYRLAVVDLSLAGMDHRNQDGLVVLDSLQRRAPGCSAILLSGFANVELAVSAIQDYGAYTCLRKENFKRSEFRQLVDKILAISPPPLNSLEAVPEGGTNRELPHPETGGAAGQDSNSGLVLVVEDDAGWRGLLGELLAEAGFRIRTSSSYGEAIGLLKREHYELAIADLSLASSLRPEKNLDGYNLLASTQKAGIPTIVVSGYADLGLIDQAYAEHEVFACLEKQSFDRNGFLDTVFSALNAKPVDPALETLTGRERQVLRLVSQGLTNKEIAKNLFITTNTVKRHLKSIFEKLGVNTRAAASSRAIRMGVGGSVEDQEAQ
jgi:DNA-binding NarL/FixJ family response regulator